MSLETRVAALEASVNGIVAKQEADVTDNSGAMTTGYDALAVDAAVGYTITNLRSWGLKFEDGRGNVLQLGRAGGPDEAIVAYGVTAQMTELETNSDITIVVV